MSDYQEFVIDQRKGQIVYECKTKIENLFQVEVTFTNGGTAQGQGMLWIGLKGEQEQRKKAQDYIKALTSPEERNPVSFPVSLVSRLGVNSQAHVQLEAEYGVVVSYLQKTQAVIVGNPISVALATSKLEDLKENLTRTPKPKANQQLEGFALKLGYDQADISAVFDKLGPEIDKNTFLKELINFSKERSRTVEDRRSPVPFHNGASARPNGYLRDAFTRHPGDMVASKGLPSGGGGMNHLNGINQRGFLTPENSGVVARGVVRPTAPSLQPSGVLARGVAVRTTAQTSQPSGNPMLYSMSNLDYNNMHQGNGIYMTPGNDFNQINSDGRQEEQMFQDLLRNGCRYQQFPSSDLRHIVIDGSNVAMSHGNNKVFSCKGIALCVDFFRKRGHTQITVFVPQWRKESPKPETPITDQHLLNQLEEDGYLTFTPSRRINGRRIVCYDDRFVVRLADSTDGIIVSNDNFKDLAQENPKWKEVTERRLLMYSFVTDMFMPPDDPLGRRGPTLDEFLHKGTLTHRRVCPYGRRCTYGTRCKYHHPEREDNRLLIYTTLKDMFPSKDALILNVMKKYPHEKNAERLASRILDLTYAE